MDRITREKLAYGIEVAVLSEEEEQLRLNQLRQIERHTMRAQCGSGTPRSDRAALAGFLGAAALFATIYLAEETGGLVLGASSTLRMALPLSPLAAYAAAWVYVMRRSARPATWEELIDQELVEYDPLDKEAYRRLQQRAMASGRVDVTDVADYVAMEKYAVREAAGQHRNQRHPSFADKQI